MILARYMPALALLLACGCGQQSADRLFRESERLWRTGLNRKALESVERGGKQWRDQPQSEWYWKFRLLKAELLIGSNAIKDAREWLSGGGSAPSCALDAWYLSLLGIIQRDRALLDRAFQLAGGCGDSALLLEIELKRARLENYTTRSETYLKNAVRLSWEQSDSYWRARALGESGYQRMSLSRFDQAIPLLEQAETAAKQAGADRIRERCLGNLGWCYSRLGDYDRALRALSEAVALARQVGDDDYLHRWLNDLGGVYYRRRDYRQAISYYQAAADLARRVHNEPWLTMMMDNLATTSIESGDLVSAERFNEEASALIRKNDNRTSLLHFQLNTAWIEAARNQPDRAEASFRAVIDAAAQQSQPFVLWEAQAGLARLLQANHRDSEADREYRSALATIEDEWSRLGDDRYKVTFLAQLIRFYGDYVDFLVGRGETARAAAVADSSRARVLAQRLGSEPSSVFASSQPRKAGPVVLSYWLAPARSYLWVAGPAGFSQFVLPGEAKIAQLVEQYTAAVERGHDPIERDNPAGRRLYEELVAPARALIPAGAQVILIPDGSLHELNFETLIVNDPIPHYWIEDVTVAVAPAAGLLQTPPKLRAQAARMLFLGDPAQADAAFPPLPHLQREAEIVRRTFAQPSLTALTRAEAHPKAYHAANPGDYSYIHFAAHAVANSESPLDSAVILSRMGDDYKLYARDVMSSRLQAELVTISACRGAGARSYAGEGLLGFTWAFLNAGARNVIAGLWEADDAATAHLMEEFYGRLSSGSSPAVALRSAKLKLLRSRAPDRIPYYWGPLILFTRDAELGLADRNLSASRVRSPKGDLVNARFQAGGRK